MTTPPPLVAVYPSAFNTTTSPKTVTVTTNPGDVLVVFGCAEGSGSGFGTPSGNGLTFTALQDVGTSGNFGEVTAWKATDATGGTNWTLSVSYTIGAADWGIIVFRYSGSAGVGNSAGSTGSGGPSLALTTSGANSAIAYLNTDWNAGSVASRTWRTINSITPTSGNGLEKVATQVASHYSVYSAHWNDAGAAGSKTTGLSAPTQAWAAVAVEILGSGGVTGNINQVTETDTANAILPTKNAPVAQVTETDTANTILPKRTLPINQTTETDTANSILPTKNAFISQTVETDTANSILPQRTLPIGQVTETDTANTITPSLGGAPLNRPINQVTETDTANSILPTQNAFVLQALETDIANAILVKRTLPVSQTLETDVANVITPQLSGAAVNQVIETDVAFSITPSFAGSFTGSKIDIIMQQLAAAGFTTGSVADREYARLKAATGATSGTLYDLYKLNNERPRLY